ncbi:iron-containing alcohol dehydrogenase [Fructobacillus tropaeoli]|uniref:NADH-dependent butanol dehydrogenase n=1 Tax=Fructobacillus tropaeoli TaxID=709323 RepID=A0A3F3H041_9LACO|nr:iron-containing alcohol dehydrogenase [Fructobacillus tropaeoli]GAP03537.1 NADH-dependent butanol dehydrogenase [Fructobacillus tropaeoli]
MENFTFKNTTDIRFGKDRLDTELQAAIAQFGQKVLVTYGGGSIKKSGLYERAIKALAGLDVTELSGIEPNPKIASVREGQKLVKDNDIDVILAVGGGSVIDASKVIASAKFYDGDPWDLVLDSKKRFAIDQLPVVDILTLAATGTEMNTGSVISNPETKQKLGTVGPNTPAVSFLDPSLTFSVSKWQTAAGSIDIFSHLTEQYFDQKGYENDVRNGLIEGIMRTVIKWAPVALREPDNYDARANLMWASTMALNGLPRTGNVNSWSVHPIEHELSAYYDITHGVGLGILTPHWLGFIYSEETKPYFVSLGRNVWDLTGDDDTVSTQTIAKTREWLASLDVPTTLPGVGIETDQDFDAMAKSAVQVNHLDQNAFVKMTTTDVRNLLEASMK